MSLLEDCEKDQFFFCVHSSNQCEFYVLEIGFFNSSSGIIFIKDFFQLKKELVFIFFKL